MQKKNLAFVLYGTENLSLTVKEKHRLRAFENGVLRKIFACQEQPVTGVGRKLHNGALHDLHCAPGVIRGVRSSRMERVGHGTCTGEKTP
jgi:hypothetical protein